VTTDHRARVDGIVNQPLPLNSIICGDNVETLRTIAVLYAETEGCYQSAEGVDLWDKARDARLYNGPWPVITHPPCQRWGNLACVNFARYGGEHNRPGNDGGCFASAVAAVRRWGGVLEHPAGSRAFREHGLAVPQGSGWQQAIDGSYVCEVWQSAYGHRANKATWLYYIGRPPLQLKWNRPVGTHQVGGKFGSDKAKPTLSKREANATPVAFRDELLKLVRQGVLF